MKMGGNQGFQSGLRAFKEDMKKTGKKYEFDTWNEAQDYYGGRQKEPKDDRSATDKLFDNKGNNPGLARRRFVPPGSSKDCGGTGGGAGFNPGRSVME